MSIPRNAPAVAGRNMLVRRVGAGGLVALAGVGAVGVARLGAAPRADGPAALGAPAAAAAAERGGRSAVTLVEIGRAPAQGAEIVAYDAPTNCAFATAGRDVVMLHLGSGADATVIRRIDGAGAAGFARDDGAAVSHVALDPAGRGFGVMTVIPGDRGGIPGRLVFFSTRTGEALGAVTVGYCPDSAAFTAEGDRVIVANEGEPAAHASGAVVDPPGSASVVLLDGVALAEDVRGLRQDAVVNVHFGGCALGKDVRIHPRNRDWPSLDLEPESIAIAGRLAFITLQENNAIATIDLDAMRFVRIAGLGVIEQRIDASDRDGGIAVDRVVAAMPMPDMIAAHCVEGRMLIVTANEGESRGDAGDEGLALADSARLGELARKGRLGAGAPAGRDADDAALGRLTVCAFSGDVDGDGLIDRPTALGARSVSVWDGATMALLGDTGSAFEEWTARIMPESFNSSGDSGEIDRRSDDRGPEPEGIALATIGGAPFAFVGLERPGAIAVVDLTSPERPEVVDLVPTAPAGLTGPEGLCFIPAEQSPSGAPLLLVAFEGSGALAVFRVEIAPPASGGARALR